MKYVLLKAFICFATISVFAQAGKDITASNLQPGQEVNLNIHSWFKPKVTTDENPFGIPTPDFRPQALSPNVKVIMGEKGLPIYFDGSTEVKDQVTNSRTAEAIALAYVESLQPAGIHNPAEEFSVKKVQQDDRSGNFHVRLQQQYKGVPVFGAELIAHTRAGIFTSAAGRYVPTPDLENVMPEVSHEAAVQAVVQHIGPDRVRSNWRPEELELIGGKQFRMDLCIYLAKDQNDQPYLSWQVQAFPNMLSRMIYFVDAKTGEVLHHYNSSCSFHQHRKKEEHCKHTIAQSTRPTVSEPLAVAPPPDPITGSGIDLAGNNRSFGAWEHTDGQSYLIDTSKPMYNPNGSNIPNGSMQGVIVTRDQDNVSDGPLYHITSSSSTFNNPNAVSAHANAGLCYDYYKNTFNRNGIDGEGGTINVIINVVDEFGDPMDNAYWNGYGMYWGNGDTYFTPLAKSLDVAGHEMTHGVVGSTAGLIYQDESGAMNESFADIFGVMIDRDDWGISEGIIQPGQSPTGLDRDLSNPHNGSTPDQITWQPNHYSERVITTEDNGGVHANSGIGNYAFYLFATHPEVGKETAEQVYYYTLRDRLTASSKYIDLRLAVIAEATEYWDSVIVNAAKAAFDQVGVTAGVPAQAHLASLPPGTGQEYILSVSEDEQALDLYQSDGTFIETIYEGGVLDKPSVTDNGEQVVFVNHDNQIMGVEIAYIGNNQIQYNVGVVSEDDVWRNAAISKDGRFLAALTTQNDNKIIFFDLADPIGPTPQEYFLVNPTFTQATPWLDNVLYADVLEFDYSGHFLIYDAFTHIENGDGEDLSHWDIGMLKFWENGQFTSPEAPNIRKIITGLPDHVGVANPAFAKNKPHIITFDYYTELDNGGVEFRTHVADFETGSNGPVVTNGHELSYPGFTTHDDKILFQDRSLFGGQHLRIQKLKPNMIEPMGNPMNIILAHKWGTWLNNSSRVLTPTGNDEPETPYLPIAVSPNPTSGHAQIRVTLPKAGETDWQVINPFGQTMAQGKIDLTAGENTFEINLLSLAAGTYFVRMAADGLQGMVKIAKQ